MRSSRYRYRAFCTGADGKEIEVRDLDKPTAIQVKRAFEDLGGRGAAWHCYLPAPESQVLS
jgi:hypothetical protein